MVTLLSIDQLDQEISLLREHNQKLIRELGMAQEEIFHLRRQICMDRQWVADALNFVHQPQHDSTRNHQESCNCGAEAVLQQALKRIGELEEHVEDTVKNADPYQFKIQTKPGLS